MKIYVKAEVVDRNPKKLPSKNTKHISYEVLRANFEEALKQVGLGDSNIITFNVEQLKDTLYIAFKLDNVDSIREINGREEKGTPMKLYLFTDRIGVDEIASRLEEMLSRRALIKTSDISSIEAQIAQSKNDMIKLCKAALKAYNCEGNIADPSSYIADDWVSTDITLTSINGYKYSYEKHGNSVFNINGHEVTAFETSITWAFQESYEENKADIFRRVKETVDEFTSTLNRWNAIDKAISSLEHSVPTILDKFVNAYSSKYPDLDISNIRITPPTYVYDGRGDINISFDLTAFNGQLDLGLSFTDVEWNSMDINKKLENIIKYRKRKYGI